MLKPDAKESARENRRLQTMPAFPVSYLDVKTFTRQFDRYASDQLGFRKQFIQSNRRLRFELFGVLNSKRCFLGKDLWLFLDRTDDSFDHKRVIAGEEGLNERSVSRWIQFLREQADQLDAAGIHFVVAFIPNKYALYPEQLPEGLECDLEGIPYLPIARGLQDHPNLKVIDLLAALLEAKPQTLLYSPADYHWNGRGAYFGYREIIRVLKGSFPEITIRPHADFTQTSEIITNVRNFRKPVVNLARFTGMPHRFSHEWLSVLPKHSNAIEGGLPDIRWPPRKFRVWAPAAFENESATGPRTVYIGDSFRWPITHLLAENVKRVLFVDARHVLFDKEMLDAEKPELVIFSIHSYFLMNNRDPYLLADAIAETRPDSAAASHDEDKSND